MDFATPAGFALFESLVQRFYRPGPSQDIQILEKNLQAIQVSEQGWQVADALLQSGDRDVRFFGALTFTIKIKRDWDTLSETDKAPLLARLLQHLVRLTNRIESALVLKKLCNALIAYHLMPDASWRQPVLDVMVALARGQGLHFEGFSPSIIARNIGSLQLQVSLWVAMGLAEEAKQALAVNSENHQYHERIGTNVHDVVPLLSASMDLSIQRGEMGLKHVREGMKCFHSWVTYIQRVWMDRFPQLSSLQALMPQAIQALDHKELYEESCDLLSDLLETFSVFLTDNDATTLAVLLSGPRIQHMLAELVAGKYNPEAATFARLCLAYGDAYLQNLVLRDDPNNEQILEQLMQLLNHKGYPGVEDDEFCTLALTFWESYLELTTNSLYTLEPDEKPPWMHVARQRVLEVLEICWIKVRQPSDEYAAARGWDSDERTNFRAYRNDVQDFLQSSYVLLGVDIFEKFAWLAIKAVGEQAWLELEASIFCLNALSEAVSEEPTVDNILSKLLDSALFSETTTRGIEIPAKTKQKAVTMITKFISFFERHNDYLPAMLNYLFHSLEEPLLANVAAKAIFTACSTCRTVLIPELNAFIHQYRAIRLRDNVDMNTEEKVLGGITAIIQALPTEELKVEPLRTLVTFVESDARRCLDAKVSDPKGSQAFGVSALRALASMGRALQTPDHFAVDLDAEFQHSQVWITGQGANLQDNIINIVRMLTTLMPWNSDIMEAACQILRAGYKETALGLFVFHPRVTVSFFLATSLQTSRLDLIIYTATAMLVQSSSAPSDMPAAAMTCLDHAIKLAASLEYNPSIEPELAASILDLADKSVPRYLTSMSRLPEIDRIFAFAISSLASADIMPNRAAAEFWSKFVQRYELDSEEATRFQEEILGKWGLTLCKCLVNGIAGEVPRSRLDTMADPLRKLIFAQPKAKQWLWIALESPYFPSQKIDSSHKYHWLRKVTSLRGSRKTNNEVKAFWVACRGPESNFAF